MDETNMDSDALILITQIMEQNAKDAAFTTNALLEGYKNAAEHAQATVDAIRWRIRKLFDTGFQPSESAIIAAIWPSDEIIQDFLPQRNSN